MAGVHLHVHSAYSFLEGASSPDQLIDAAYAKGIEILALTDTHRLSGAIAFLQAAEKAGIKALLGAEVEVEEDGRLVLLVPDTDAYPHLTTLLTEAHLTSPRGRPRVSWDLLAQWGPRLVALTGDRQGVLARAWLARDRHRMTALLERLQKIFPVGQLYLELTATYLPGDRTLFRALRDLGEHTGVPMLATGAVHYATKEQFGLYDVMTCIRTGQTIESATPQRSLNAENYLKSWEEMKTALGSWPHALNNAMALGERLSTPRLLHQRRPPLFLPPKGMTADEYLAALVRRGAKERYRERMSAVWPRVAHELAVIRDLGFADYFLVVWDVTRYARARGIRFAGRGSAADSVVAYCLGITDVDAFARNLLFERFMSRERQETPDIDMDFDARFRDEVAEYVRQRYGSLHVARIATYQTYRPRLAVREAGKVMGFPPAELDALAKSLPQADIGTILARWDEIPELRQYPETDRLRRVLSWAKALEGLPRHLGTHLGGLVISRDPLDRIGPRERSAKGIEILAFDKRDVEALGLMKLDLLSLPTFTAVEIASDAIASRTPEFRYDTVPVTDEATYRRLQRGEGVGVFQLESPAQRSLALRLQPDRWEDIVASLALIRPGPIKGNMVDPFIARRRGEEPVTYLHPALEPILEKTYGVILFQEQVIGIASTLAGFTPGEADQLRRVMTHGRSEREMQVLGERFQEKAMARGVDRETAQAVFRQMVGYASYGFNEAHAAAFAQTAYRTAYLWEHYPREYLLGLINAQPLGYYPIDVLLVEARARGIEILPMDINRSGAMATLEGADAIRIGMGFLRGMGFRLAEQVASRRPPGGYRHPQDVHALANVPLAILRALVTVGAFDSLSPDRDGWLEGLHDHNGLGLQGRSRRGRQWSEIEQIQADYRHLGFGAHGHWLEPWREHLTREGVRTVRDIRQMAPGLFTRTVGMLIRPHRPPTRSGKIVVFFSLLDETGVLEARLSTAGYQKYGHWLFGGQYPVLAVAGRREPQGIAVTAIAPWPPRR